MMGLARSIGVDRSVGLDVPTTPTPLNGGGYALDMVGEDAAELAAEGGRAIGIAIG